MLLNLVTSHTVFGSDDRWAGEPFMQSRKAEPAILGGPSFFTCLKGHFSPAHYMSSLWSLNVCGGPMDRTPGVRFERESLYYK